LESSLSFNVNFSLDLTLDASNLGYGIRLDQSEIERSVSLDAEIYI